MASGCQGEPQGSVAQIARGEHRLVSLQQGDTLIFSARVIPGNERAVATLFDQLAERGVFVRLYDMKPERLSPAHSSPDMAELVCSNSLRANTLGNAVGLLKEEMRRLGSLVIRVADETMKRFALFAE